MIEHLDTEESHKNFTKAVTLSLGSTKRQNIGQKFHFIHFNNLDGLIVQLTLCPAGPRPPGVPGKPVLP